MRGSCIIVPTGCITPGPLTIRSVIGVAALPMSTWPTAMSYLRPSRLEAFVRPVMACLVDVYAEEYGRGACAEIEPLLMMRPPIGFWSIMMRKACWVHWFGFL